MSSPDNETDQITRQNYSGNFTGSNLIIGNQHATGDVNNIAGPRQHTPIDWSQTNHSRSAPSPPSRTIYYARASHDFQPTQANELCFKAGDIIELTQGDVPNRDGWFMGRVEGRPEEEGLVPEDYVVVTR